MRFLRCRPPLLLPALVLLLTACSLDDPVAPDVPVEPDPAERATPAFLPIATLLGDPVIQAMIGRLEMPEATRLRSMLDDVLERTVDGDLDAVRGAIEPAHAATSDVRPSVVGSPDELIALSVIDFVLLRAEADLAR